MTAQTVAVAGASAQPGARHPKISICIPVYQAERYLAATLESVLAQNYSDFEVVVVDNHCTDGTGAILASVDDRRVRVVRNHATLPMADNFNLAVSLCRGDYVKLICADDTLEPDCVARQSKVLDENPDVALVGVQTDFIDDDGKMLRPARGLRGIVGRQCAPHVVRRLVRSGTNPIGPPAAVMFRRTDFERAGGFRGDLPFVMDMELWVRLLAHGDFVGIPRPLASFRFGSESTTALTSARSQLAQQARFVEQVTRDPRWGVTTFDRVLGRINVCDMQARRTLLFKLSQRRSARGARR